MSNNISDNYYEKMESLLYF